MVKYWLANNPDAEITDAEVTALGLLTQTEIEILDGATVSTAELNTLDGIGATVDEINNKCDGSASYVLTTTVTATEVLKASDTGRTMLLGSTVAGGTQAMLLPAEAAGLNYKFVYVGTAVSTSTFTLGTEAAANYFIGGLLHCDTDSTAGLQASVNSDGNSNSLLSVITPDAGTEFEVLSNGTGWYIWGFVASATAPTIADT